MSKEHWLKSELAQLNQAGLSRSLRSVMTAPTGHILLDGREVVLLGSNNYLGLSVHPIVVEAATTALQKYGTGASASRLMSGNCDLYTGLETKIAKAKGTEAALVFASGYLANIGTIPVLGRRWRSHS